MGSINVVSTSPYGLDEGWLQEFQIFSCSLQRKEEKTNYLNYSSEWEHYYFDNRNSALAQDYFADLFFASPYHMDEGLYASLTSCVTDSDNLEFSKIPDEAEILTAIKLMNANVRTMLEHPH